MEFLRKLFDRSGRKTDYVKDEVDDVTQGEYTKTRSYKRREEEEEDEVYQELSRIQDPFDEIFRPERKEQDLHSIRINSDIKIEIPSVPSANEIRRKLLEAEHAHKLWKIRKRLKNYGLAPNERLIEIELDEKGPYKWEYMLKQAPVERYINALNYIRHLGRKEAIKSGHFGNITSETTEEQMAGLHKKLRLDFRLNDKGQPSNMSVGEDSTSSDYSEDDLISEYSDDFQQEEKINSIRDEQKELSKENMKFIYTPQSDGNLFSSSSVNVLKELQKDSNPNAIAETNPFPFKTHHPLLPSLSHREQPPAVNQQTDASHNYCINFSFLHTDSENEEIEMNTLK